MQIFIVAINIVITMKLPKNLKMTLLYKTQKILY